MDEKELGQHRSVESLSDAGNDSKQDQSPVSKIQEEVWHALDAASCLSREHSLVSEAMFAAGSAAMGSVATVVGAMEIVSSPITAGYGLAATDEQIALKYTEGKKIMAQGLAMLQHSGYEIFGQVECNETSLEKNQRIPVK